MNNNKSTIKPTDAFTSGATTDYTLNDKMVNLVKSTKSTQVIEDKKEIKSKEDKKE